MQDALHPLVSGFSDAETYDRGRPVYGESVARALLEPLGLGAGAPVLELGAGTGQLSRAVLALGFDLTAVEPLGATRELLCRAIGRERVRAGVAEDIPLRNDSVQAVLAAEAFHWFDETRAMPEIKRVLRRGGGVAIMRTVPQWDMPWMGDLVKLFEGLHADHPAFGERGAADALEEDPDFGPVTESSATSTRTIDGRQFLAYVASFSWIATLEPRRRSGLLSDVERLLDEHGVRELAFEQHHQIWTALLA